MRVEGTLVGYSYYSETDDKRESGGVKKLKQNKKHWEDFRNDTSCSVDHCIQEI